MTMNEEAIQFTLYDENGILRTYEEIENDLKNVYEKLSSLDKNKQTIDFFDLFTDPQANFSPPEVIEKYQFIERKLYLDKEITGETGKKFLEQIQFWNAEDSFNKTPIENRIPIQIYIDSPGGLVTTSLEIIDSIKNSKTPVVTIVTGTAYSGAFLIAIAGHKRFAFKNATFLFHEGFCETMGDAHKVLQQSEFYKNFLLKSIKDHVIKSTNISSSLYEEHKKDDWYFGSKKALKLGVIDEICNDVNGGLYDED